jgi:predicted  nucleic acid-binding Zn-ribbon protein
MEKQARINMLVGSLTEKEQKLQEAEQQITDAENTITAIESGGATWVADQNTVHDYKTRMSDLTDLKSENDKLEARLNKWESATRAINELNTQITNNQNTLSTWDEDHTDRYTQLMAYWDMLETGRDFHTGKMYNWGTLKKSTAQKNFDNKKNTYIADYLAQYGRIA